MTKYLIKRILSQYKNDICWTQSEPIFQALDTANIVSFVFSENNDLSRSSHCVEQLESLAKMHQIYKKKEQLEKMHKVEKTIIGTLGLRFIEDT